MLSKPDKPDYEGIARVLSEHAGKAITAEELETEVESVAQTGNVKRELEMVIAPHLGLGWQVEVIRGEYQTLEEVATSGEEANWEAVSSPHDFVTAYDVETYCKWISRVQDAKVELINICYDHDDPDVQEAQQTLDNAEWEYIPDALEALVKAAKAASAD